MNSPLYKEKEERKLQAVIKDISKEIQKNENNSELYFNRALQYYQLSQQYYDVLELFIEGDKEKYFKYVNKAYEDVDKALSFKQEIADYAYSFKLFMLKKLKRWDALINYGKELYNSIGCTDSDLILIGEAYFYLKDWNNCIEYYTKIIDKMGYEKANSFNRKIFLERGLAYDELDKNEAALNNYLQYLDLNGASPFDRYNIYALIAVQYEKLGNYKKAIEFYTKSLEEYTESTSIYFRRGKIYLDMFRDYSNAAEDFYKAIECSDTDNYFCYHECGYSYCHKAEIDIDNKNYQLALQDYDRAIWAYGCAM